MKFIFLLLLFPVVFSCWSQKIININPDPNGDPWWVGGLRILTPEERAKIQEMTLPDNLTMAVLPSRVNNSQTKYFRQIFVQQSGSCAQASGIAYTFTYELNFLRNLSSKDSANQYPTHFTYNFLDGGNGNNGSNYTDGWQIIKENGCPNLKDYGGLYPITDSGWISGYGKYFDGMFNRVNNYYKITVNTPAGLNILKRWLVDHGNSSATGGLACFSAGAAGIRTSRIATNQYEGKRFIVTYWSNPVDHAMTFVGYDDSVRFDFNGDGKFTNDIDINKDATIDMKDWEIGAMIMANSWGKSWSDSGYCYVPYRDLALGEKNAGIGYGEVYVVVPKVSYQPEMTIKVKISHNYRNRLTIRAGVSENAFADKPDYEMNFTAFDRKGGSMPMQGINKNPLEFGLDISPLLHQSHIEPAKIFLKIIESNKGGDGSGNIIKWSLLDYRHALKEYVAEDTNLEILNDSITLSSIVPGGTDAIPGNLTATMQPGGILLKWNRPHDTTGFLRYQVYMNNGIYLYSRDTFITINIVPNGTMFKIKTETKNNVSFPSNTLIIENNLHLPVANSGYTLHFNGITNYVHVPGSMDMADKNLTVEFWARRMPDVASACAFSQGKWDSVSRGFRFSFRSNRPSCGFWGDELRSDIDYTDSAWHHWCFTFDTATKTQTLYRDGIKITERKAKKQYMGFGEIYIGCQSGSTSFFNGEIDELRIWNSVRSTSQLNDYRYKTLPFSDSTLLACWRFDEQSGDTLLDRSSGMHNGILQTFIGLRWLPSGAWSNRFISSLNDSLHIFAGYSKYLHTIKYDIIQPPNFGTVSTDALNTGFLYKANSVFSGIDSFLFEVTDDTLVANSVVYIYPEFPLALQPLSNKYDVNVFPNPSYGSVNLEMKGWHPGKVSLQLKDISGRILINKEYTIISNTGEILHLNLEDLPGGIYFISLTGNNENKVIQLIRTK